MKALSQRDLIFVYLLNEWGLGMTSSTVFGKEDGRDSLP
jgi:hypothetical protein